MHAFPLVAAALVAQAIGGGDALEPSVLNEVSHALDRAPAVTNVSAVTGDVFGTNGLSATDVALRLVSRQRPDGTWRIAGTNVTAEAVKILSALAGEEEVRR